MKILIPLIIAIFLAMPCQAVKIYDYEVGSKKSKKVKKIKNKDKDDLVTYLLSKGKETDKLKEGYDYYDIDLADMLYLQLNATVEPK